MHMAANNWRVIGKDSQDRESVADIVRIDNVTEAQARDFADRLNADAGDYASRWYIAQPASDKLWGGMEELV
jgi:hypothetical protein